MADLEAPVDPSSVTAATFVVRSGFHWPTTGSLAVSGSVVTFTPSAPFRLGEEVEVTLTAGIRAGGSPLAPRFWKFRVTGGTAGLGSFQDSGQALGADTRNNQFALGDFRRLGRLDALWANWNGPPAQVWTNDGNGIFSRGADLSALDNEGVACADFNGDGNPDAAFNVRGGEASVVWFGDASGGFADSTQRLAVGNSLGIAAGGTEPLVSAGFAPGARSGGWKGWTVPATGRYLAVLYLDGVGAGPGGYALKVKVRPARGNARIRGAAAAGECAFDAADGSLLRGALRGGDVDPASVAITGPDGPVAVAGRGRTGRARFGPIRLDAGTGTYRVAFAATGPVAYALRSRLPGPAAVLEE